MLTVKEIIREALEDLGVVGIGEYVSDEDYQACLPRVKSLLDFIRSEGILVKFSDTQSITTAAATLEYDTAAGTVRVLNFSDTNVNVMSPQLFDQQGSDSSSTKTNVLVDYSVEPPKITFGIQPAVGVDFEYRRIYADTTVTIDTTPVFPSGATELLIAGTGFFVSKKYRVPPQERSELGSEFNALLMMYKGNSSSRSSQDIVQPSMVI